MTVTIRRAEPGDLDRVGELTAHAYLADGLISGADDYLHELRDAARRAEHATVLVAVDGQRVVGTITLGPDRRTRRSRCRGSGSCGCWRSTLPLVVGAWGRP